LGEIDKDSIIGFFDEFSPQTTANTQRLWSFSKPTISKNTTRMKANTFGFYPINGTPVIDFKEHSKKEDVCEFLRKIRESNPGKQIVLILDNFRSHRAKLTTETADEIGLDLVFLPPYSPDLNPIEFIWKSIKRVISREFIKDLAHMRCLIGQKFLEFASSLGYANRWIMKFVNGDI